jgi:hypothetical protein
MQTHYTQATAAHHGCLLAHVRRSGSPRGAHDLIIAAHAAETGRTPLPVPSRSVGNLLQERCNGLEWLYDKAFYQVRTVSAPGRIRTRDPLLRRYVLRVAGCRPVSLHKLSIRDYDG